MSVTESFLERYTREFDFFREAARICAQKCEAALVQSGIRAIVTYRAKNPERLRDKVGARNKEKKYKRTDQIFKDIVDLAGVRIALYFPGDMEEVERLTQTIMDVEESKRFPDKDVEPAYSKRFSGYSARHYRVKLRSADLSDIDKRYSHALIEIQVASILVHAWAEVEHDLVYKPLSGKLSEDEYAILDELNGLVLAGEIALERLQRAGEQRVRTAKERFSNHYELADYIFTKVSSG